MKFPIKWHENCYDSMRKHLKEKQLKLESLQKEISRLQSDIECYKNQIDSAKKENKDSFDPDSYLKARK